MRQLQLEDAIRTLYGIFYYHYHSCSIRPATNDSFALHHIYIITICPPASLLTLRNQTQLHSNTNVGLRLTQHDLIHPCPSALRHPQQLLREVLHEEPGDRLLRTVHEDLDAAVTEPEAVLGGQFGPSAPGLDEDGSVEVDEGPGGGF